MEGRGRSDRSVVMKPNTILPHGRGVADFLAQHGDKVTGVVSGYDRLRLQGTLRGLYLQDLFEIYLSRAGVLFKNYVSHVKEVSGRLCDAADEIARQGGTAVHFVRSPNTRKEDLVAEALRAHPKSEGLVAVLSATEPCRTWKMYGNWQTKRLEPRLVSAKCLHLYFYFIHEVFGLMHLRLQTWFPFLVHFCLNGREWLCRQLQREGIAYERADNCLPWIEDFPRAQALLNAQTKTPFQNYLPDLIKRFHPSHQRLHDLIPVDYYWTVAESEYATDLMFQDRASVQAVYPSLVHHAIMSFGAKDVLRFLGHKQAGDNRVESSLLTREEGTRVKHWVNHNSIKVYDKGSVLRTECTINVAESFRVWRPSERDPKGPKAWRYMRRAVADMPRRAEVSRAANDRYVGALAAVANPQPLNQVVTAVCRPITRKARRYRALNVFNPADAALLAVVNHGDFVLHGLRNRDLRERLYPQPPAGLTNRQLTARVSRQLALLHAHGLIARVSKTHLYRVTKKGRTLITATLAAGHASLEQLTKLAA
jgi:hypothetical protein